MTITNKLLTAGQVAGHLGMHIKTLYKLLRQNKISLQYIRRGGRTILFRPTDVENYLKQNEVTRTGSGVGKPAKRTSKEGPSKYVPMTDSEAQKFFKSVERSSNGEIICGPFEKEESYPEN